MNISGFTFIHNAIESGYPIVEAIRAVAPYVSEVVVVDMQSTDETRELLEAMKYYNEALDGSKMDVLGMWQNNPPLRILDGQWGDQAGETLRTSHSRYIECAGDVIIHFEADEVYDDNLLKEIVQYIENGINSLSVYRLQLEMNFQRCRWYPEPVHRIFPRFSNARKEGHTTDQHSQSPILPPENGYLWDVTNCFRDNWLNRVNKQAELRQDDPQYIMTPVHTLHRSELTETEAHHKLAGGNFWGWKSTPFDIPEILKPLVGMTRYEGRL